ncbi:hypothetical protein HHK36_028912 [Tetracentron sinense]|uniref:Protein SHORTAGE IN CHIASMATA 1 n=1 Tax=Tetracentron sinense TaxID=13715 RepID=A0A835D0P1_TETSI|nr:hypothetical protein HHK36_028912 [Tetracentron sinense]
MRSRFLAVDYFNCASNEAQEYLEFLRLPVPHLVPSNICKEADICSAFDSVSSIPLEIETFPIDNALSRFLAYVLPRSIDVGNGDFPVICSQNRKSCSDERKNVENRRNFRSKTVEIRFPENENSCSDNELDEEDKLRNFRYEPLQIEITEKEAELLYEEKAVESLRTFRSEALAIEFPKKENGSTADEKGENKFKVIQFEAPELDLFAKENACFSEKEERQIISEVLKIENPLDIIDPGVTIQFPYEVSESVNSVEYITSEYHMEQKDSSVEDADSVQDKTCLYTSKFPLLEVNEIVVEFYKSRSMEDGLLLLFENIGQQHWTQKDDDLMADGKELLGCTDVDILDFFSDRCPSKQCLEPELTCLNLVLEMDFITLKEKTNIQGNSVIQLEASDNDYFSVVSPVHFHQVQILDLESSQVFDVFASLTANEPEKCDQMFIEDVNTTGNFYESIVSHELALVDDTFKSLPIPVLSDDKKLKSLYAVVKEILAGLKPRPPSASDGIYLDWHLLEKDRCHRDICSSYRNMLEEIDTYSIDSDLNSVDYGIVVIDFVFCNDTPNGPNMLESKEVLHELTASNSMVNEPLIKITPSQLLKDVGQKPGNGESLLQMNGEKVSMFESMSQFNDLDFFLNPSKGITRRNSEPAVKKTPDTKAKLPVVSSGDSISICASAEAKLQQWDIEVHQVKLSDHILGLIENFKRSYLAILENNPELKRKHYSSSVVENYELLSLPKQKLMDWIKNSSFRQTTLAVRDETIMAYVTLYAIKQMCCYLCFYGIHTTNLYVDNLCGSMEYLRLRLSFLQSLIEDAHWKYVNEIAESHPSLTVIQGILRSNTSQSGLKILIVADQVFWWPLKRLLTSMRILYNEVKNIHTHTNQPDAWDSDEFTNATIKTLLHSDCLLFSHEHVSASFPFNKFSIILEYGGVYGSSRISTISPKLSGLPRLHFLKVELEEFSVPKALCEGVNVPQNTEFTMGGVSQSILALHEAIKNQKFEELLNIVPVEAKHIYMGSSGAADKVQACCVPMPVPCVPVGMESKQIQSNMPSFPDIVVIVNTQNLDKEMLISRRSTYQRILALENGGAQVVEREINLPVDLILSAAMCLVWYDDKNIGNKTTATDEASPCIPLCVENIATNILTLLSFSFSGCILVFEGERSFLAAIMESSDELYAAAASLGLDLQLFCSYSSDLTDEIILSWIGHATKLNALYPKLPESETLAESFLTGFPSINSLSSHAILSSGSMLIEFLEWSHERRVRAIRKYHVPDESVALFSALCRYGDREESKSEMTECSSSVSSAPDSGNSHCKIDPDRKKRKFIMSPQKFDIPMDDFMKFDPLNRSTDVSLKPSKTSEPSQSQIMKGPEILDEMEKFCLSLNDKSFDQKQGLDIPMMNNLDWDDTNNSVNVRGDFIGEVIDHDNGSLLGEDFSSIVNTISFSTRVPEMEKDPTAGNSRTTKRLPFGRSYHPAFPTAADSNSDTDIWSSLKDHNQQLEGDICGHLDTDSSKDTLPLKRRKELLEEDSMQKSTRNYYGLSFQENNVPPYGGTPLSNAIHSSRLQQGSPWTIEFLNRIREKSRMHQQSLPCESDPTCLGLGKITKRKTPSAPDCYRYQGSSFPKKIIKQKRQKRFTLPSSSSKNEKTFASLLPTWTPIDKRARQALSFVRNGNETQSKLVWNDGNVQRLRKRFQNQA